jgi:hypothetical protein
LKNKRKIKDEKRLCMNIDILPDERALPANLKRAQPQQPDAWQLPAKPVFLCVARALHLARKWHFV